MREHALKNHSAVTEAPSRFEDAVLVFRIQAEFAEMPGLKLTLPQASRLFHLDFDRCQQVMTTLVATGQLAVRGNAFVQGTSARRRRSTLRDPGRGPC